MKKKLLMGVEEVTAVFSQEQDGCSPFEGTEGRQSIRVEIHDGGGGPYVVISTERWAFDDPSEFVDTLNTLLQVAEDMAEGINVRPDPQASVVSLED
jgi:hypothetical protein